MPTKLKLNTEPIYNAMIDCIENDTDNVISQEEILKKIYKNNNLTTNRQILTAIKSLITKTLTHSDDFIDAQYKLDKDKYGNVIYIKIKEQKTESKIISTLFKQRLIEHLNNLKNSNPTIFAEQIRPTREKYADSDSSLYTIEEVVDSENLTEWVCNKLNQLKQNSNIQNWDFTITTGSYYVRDRRNGKVNNQINITDPESSGRWFDAKSFIIKCVDGEIIITPEHLSFSKSNWNGELTFFYKDVNKQDANEIANYIFDVLNSKHNPENKRIAQIKDNNRYTRPREIDNEISEVLTQLEHVCEDIAIKLPRGKQRTKIVKINDRNNVTGEVQVQYRQNSTKPYFGLCTFEVIKQSQQKPLYDVVCYASDGSELAVLTIEGTEDSNAKFNLDEDKIEECIFDAYDIANL